MTKLAEKLLIYSYPSGICVWCGLWFPEVDCSACKECMEFMGKKFGDNSKAKIKSMNKDMVDE